MTEEQFAPFPREVRLRPSRQPTVQKHMMLQANDILEHLKGEMAHRTEPLISIGADDDNGTDRRGRRLVYQFEAPERGEIGTKNPRNMKRDHRKQIKKKRTKEKYRRARENAGGTPSNPRVQSGERVFCGCKFGLDAESFLPNENVGAGWRSKKRVRNLPTLMCLSTEFFCLSKLTLFARMAVF